MSSHPPERDEPPPAQEDDYTSSRRSKGRFRFKSSSSSTTHHKRDRDRSRDRTRERSHRSSRRRDHRRRTNTHHACPRSRSRSPTPISQQTPTLDAEAAFRESLFDAMGDDEGAAYWEGVYGQPIHSYAVPEVPKGPEGELERMDEEEYASYVRSQMWARTREGMMAEQDRLRAERRKAKIQEERSRGREAEREAFERAMEDSLRRGAERRKVKAWGVAWAEYLAGWEGIKGAILRCQEGKDAGTTAATPSGEEKAEDRASTSATALRNLLFWPVQSGKRGDVTPVAVRDFLKHAPEGDLLSTLKTERVRWHPDKIQHRYGALGIDDKVMRSVTEIFQIVDQMWNEERERAGKA